MGEFDWLFPRDSFCPPPGEVDDELPVEVLGDLWQQED